MRGGGKNMPGPHDFGTHALLSMSAHVLNALRSVRTKVGEATNAPTRRPGQTLEAAREGRRAESVSGHVLQKGRDMVRSEEEKLLRVVSMRCHAWLNCMKTPGNAVRTRTRWLFPLYALQVCFQITHVTRETRIDLITTVCSSGLWLQHTDTLPFK